MKLFKRILILTTFSLSLFTLHACGNDDVIEQAPTVTVVCTPSELTFGVDGGNSTFTVDATREFSVYTEADWLKVSPESSGKGKVEITVTASKNETYADAPRTATVVVKSGTKRATVSVSQESPVRPTGGDIKCSVDGYDYLVWNDEFEEGSALSSDKWTHEVKNQGWVNNELQNYVNKTSPDGKKVTEVAGGVLKINCFKENGKVYSGRVYGNVNKGFVYGVVEARIKLPKGKGTWPAFWMMPVKYTSWPHCGEIDIMEEVGADPNIVSSSIHCSAYNHTINTQKTHNMTCQGAEGEFHIYTLEWTADYIQTYVDGKKQLYFANDKKNNDDTWPFHVAFYPILNLAWGGDWGGYKGVDESALPCTMEVDWVRVFQK